MSGTIYNSQRYNYWNNKYRLNQEDWHEDIHFAIFPNLRYSTDSFKEGIKLNTELLAKEIIESSSIYNLAGKPRILDFACGSGDLLFKLSAVLQHATCYGVDLSDMALEKAKKKIQNLPDEKKRQSINFRQGGVEQLQEIMQETGGASFDVIVCRDAYYLFSKQEQETLLTSVCSLLKPTGIFFLSDLAVAQPAAAEVDRYLIERQYGGMPISVDSTGQAFSVQHDFARLGLEEIRQVHQDMTSIGWSYQAAAEIADDPIVQQAYQGIANASRIVRKKNGAWSSAIPYVSFAVKLANPEVSKHDKMQMGLKLGRDFYYRSSGDKLILRKGEYFFPINEWSLIIGKSGSGKSTLLNLIADMIKGYDKVDRHNIPGKIFYLKQHPVLIRELTVEANLSIFAQDKKMVSETLTNLGLGGSIRKRRIAHNLSGGEEQRVALGQAIVSRPDMLLLDEPCTGVDKVIKYQFFSSIKSQFHEHPLSLLCVDHDYHMVESFFDNVFEIMNGKLYLINRS